jgi:hypothetical protein
MYAYTVSAGFTAAGAFGVVGCEPVGGNDAWVQPVIAKIKLRQIGRNNKYLLNDDG